MEIDVASAIEEMLDRRKTVSINGLGSLVLENYSAKVSDDGGSIRPPSAKLAYYDTQTKNKSLRKYISEEYNITREQAAKAISKFSESVVNALSNYGEVNIKGVVYIQRKSGQIHVKASDSFITKYYKGLSPVSIDNKSTSGDKLKSRADKGVIGQAAATIAATTAAVTSASNKLSVDKPTSASAVPSTAGTANKLSADKPSASSAVPSTAGAANKPVAKPYSPPPASASKKAAIPVSSTPTPQGPPPAKPVSPPIKAPTPAANSLPKSSTSQPATGLSINELFSANNPSTEKSTANIKTNQNKAITSGHTNTNEKVIPPTTTNYNNNPAPPPPVYVKEKTGWGGPILGLLGLLLFCFLMYKGCNKIMGYNEGATSTVADTTEEGMQNAGERAESTSAKASELSGSDAENNNSNADGGTEDYESSSTGAGTDLSECIIITGVFSRYSNIDKMINLIERKGYQSYQEAYGSYTRVGLTFDCKNVDLESYLSKIRKQISRRAWYLQPELYVEYSN